jgi:hypothetical protein
MRKFFSLVPAPVAHSHASPTRPFSPSPLLPSALRALPFALCSLRSIMNAVRAQPLTRLAAISDRDPDQVIFR